MVSPECAFLIGEPAELAAKILRSSEVLGGVSRITFQMGIASLVTVAMKRSIEILGTKVASIVRKETVRSVHGQSL